MKCKISYIQTTTHTFYYIGGFHLCIIRLENIFFSFKMKTIKLLYYDNLNRQKDGQRDVYKLFETIVLEFFLAIQMIKRFITNLKFLEKANTIFFTFLKSIKILVFFTSTSYIKLSLYILPCLLMSNFLSVIILFFT